MTDGIICFSHLRWNFVYQRPQHLMSRWAKTQRVFYFEEPVFAPEAEVKPELSTLDETLTVVVPRLPEGLDPSQQVEAQRVVLDRLCEEQGIENPLLWYYTPMSGAFSAHLPAKRIVYDCMDELSAFSGAPPELVSEERRLLDRADVVFTGGYSLYEAKRQQHANVHAFPSSVDVAHFRRARERLPDPPDQAGIPRPRIGHYAVIDERLDIDLVAAIADARPDWQLILLGPVVKIDPASLPQRPNIHYLGGKSYSELPAYLAGWDVAFMPFALQRVHPLHQPHQDPGIPGRRPAGRLHADPRRGPDLWRRRAGADRRHGPGDGGRHRGRPCWSVHRPRLAPRRRPPPRHDVLGSHLGADEGSDC